MAPSSFRRRRLEGNVNRAKGAKRGEGNRALDGNLLFGSAFLLVIAILARRRITINVTRILREKCRVRGHAVVSDSIEFYSKRSEIRCEISFRFTFRKHLSTFNAIYANVEI